MRIEIFLISAFFSFTCSVFSQTTNVPDLALAGARIYPSPFAAPIENGIVLMIRSRNRAGRRRGYSCSYNSRRRQSLEFGYPPDDACSAHVGYSNTEALERRAPEKWSKRPDA